MNAKNIIYVIIILLIISLSVVFLDTTVENNGGGYLTQQQALEIAENTDEIAALYRLRNGQYKECIEKSVLPSCESTWVTCVDDVWVVQFSFNEKCSIKHDGRLGATLLVDALSGKVISRFPEAEYFNDEKFCLEHYDCVYLSSKEEGPMCLNFIYGQLDGGNDRSIGNKACQCAKNRCFIKK